MVLLVLCWVELGLRAWVYVISIDVVGSIVLAGLANDRWVNIGDLRRKDARILRRGCRIL